MDIQSLYNQAVTAHRQGDLAGAERNLSEAIRLEPTWAAPRVNLALVLHRLGDLEGALGSARKAALLDPDNAKELVAAGARFAADPQAVAEAVDAVITQAEKAARKRTAPMAPCPSHNR